MESLIKILKNKKNKDPDFKLTLNNMHSFNISKYIVKKYGGIKKLNKIIDDELIKENYIILN